MPILSKRQSLFTSALTCERNRAGALSKRSNQQREKVSSNAIRPVLDSLFDEGIVAIGKYTAATCGFQLTSLLHREKAISFHVL